MVFNIDSQHADIINNVAGSQYNYGGQQTSSVSIQAVNSAVELRDALRDLGMPEAAGEADGIKRELEKPAPDRKNIAARLTRIAHAVSATAGAAAAVCGPLAALGHWLGPAGESILAMIGL